MTVYSQPGLRHHLRNLPAARRGSRRPRAHRTSAKGSETILLVDDEEGVRKLVSAILKSNGYDVLEAGNGPAALAVYEKNAHKIDLVLTDVVMPQMSGFELAQELAGRAPRPEDPLYVGLPRQAFGANGEPPRAFLQKPFTPDVLLLKVREVLDSELI